MNPKLSIVTTVYDRINCLRQCIASVHALNFKNYEHIIVSDFPPSNVRRTISQIASMSGARHVNTSTRTNNWGIGPAIAGLEAARGDYVAFLSDDNGYLPHHFDALVARLDENPELGFVYSSCHYFTDAYFRLGCYPPLCGQVDLGQLLYRRSLLAFGIPFHQYDWDCEMFKKLLMAGVKCEWIDDASFVFRLSNQPQFIAT